MMYLLDEIYVFEASSVDKVVMVFFELFIEFIEWFII